MIKNRQTGRTTRMLEEAVRCAKEGKAVYVIVNDPAHILSIQLILNKLGGEKMGIKVETFDSVGWDFYYWTVRGANPNCKFFVDHYAIEDRFRHIIEEMHRYDLKR